MSMVTEWMHQQWLRAALRLGFWCERCQHNYRDENECPRHGR